MAPPARMTLGALLDGVAARHGQVTAILDLPSGTSLTYAQFKEQSDHLAKGLIDLGLEQGQHLALWAPNLPAWLVCQYGAAKAGLVLTNLETGISDKDLLYKLAQSDARCLVMHPGEDQAAWRTLLAVAPEAATAAPGKLESPPLPNLRHLVFMGSAPMDNGLTLEALLDRGRALPDQDLAQRTAQLDCDQVASLFYTSGTTGAPKGVMNTHFGLINPSLAGAANQGLSAGDRLCLSVPLFHMFGSICAALAGICAGSTIVIPSRMPQPQAILEAVAGQGCTAIYGPPTAFIALMDLPAYGQADLSSLRTGIMAGAQCPLELMKRVVHEMGVSGILVGFGQTEASSWVSLTSPDDPLELRVSTVGRPVPGVEIKILDPTSGRACPPGEVGELCARGFNMTGYYKNPAATHSALDPDGWLHTGDLASQDQEGYIRVAGRLKEVIRRAGRVVFPTEIEEVLFTHPKVNNAQVFGAPHDQLGEVVVAWIKLEAGAQADAAEIAAHLAQHLPADKLPNHIQFVEQYPMTPLGKIQKFRMRELFVEAGGQRDGGE